MLRQYLQRRVYKMITGENQFKLENKTPSAEELHSKFQTINELGIYIHIPFCRQICPYCPYNKELFQSQLVTKYVASVMREIDYYAGIVGNRPVTSLYIGGGTPTTMINYGLESIINHIYKSFNMNCSIHIESHPDDLNKTNLDILKGMGVRYLSIGVEALQDRHLKMLQRTYNAMEVREAVERAVNTGFDCVNIDYIFALPGQTYQEVEMAGQMLVKMGIHQAATYPLFTFPYTRMGYKSIADKPDISLLLKRRKMLNILENVFYNADYRRSSVWAFTKSGTEKYCSVTVPLYLGIGASGGSYLNDVFFLNTFNVAEYIKAIDNNKTAASLSVNLTADMQMAGWLYWRIYETRFSKSDFFIKFGKNFDKKYGGLMNILSSAGLLSDTGEEIVLSDKGAYWLHAFEDFFSIDFISNLWGTSRVDPWPEQAILVPD